MSTQSSTTVRDIILLISVPLGLLGVLAAIAYVPQALARPAHDFIYTTCETFDCSGTMVVKSGVVEHVPETRNWRIETLVLPQLRYYDVSESSSRALTLEEAQTYALDGNTRSPDGYTLTQKESSSGFLFWSDSDSGWMLQNGMYRKPVELGGNYYSSQAQFVGWVK